MGTVARSPCSLCGKGKSLYVVPCSVTIPHRSNNCKQFFPRTAYISKNTHLRNFLMFFGEAKKHLSPSDELKKLPYGKPLFGFCKNYISFLENYVSSTNRCQNAPIMVRTYKTIGLFPHFPPTKNNLRNCCKYLRNFSIIFSRFHFASSPSDENKKLPYGKPDLPFGKNCVSIDATFVSRWWFLGQFGKK